MDAPVATAKPPPVVRPYRPADRATIREICADTGFLGKPIDPVFEDRELFADYLTAYYTDIEPESLFVCEVGGVVKGYVMGSRFPEKKKAYERSLLPRLAARGLWRLVTRPYRAASRRYIWWIMTRASRENPYTPPAIPHFHFNIRPEARSVGNTRVLLDTFLLYLHERGEKQVYGQVVAFETRRGRRMFAHFGFEVVDEREVTKYRAYYPGKIYLFTVVKDLTVRPTLYAAAAADAQELI
jgi:hypothetical protein